MKTISIRPSKATPCTELYVGENLLFSGKLQEYLDQNQLSKRRIVLIADCHVKPLYGEKLAEQLGAELIGVPSGEQAKSWTVAEQILQQLFRIGAGKDTVLLALGGGVTTDLVGFVASIYLRGVSLILIPTSLLAMVDAAIGGKTGVDTQFGKNLLGSIYPPMAIFADFDLLQTLPEKERMNGLAEILKMGLIYDATIWDQGAHHAKDPALIIKAMQAKIAIVEQDFSDHSLRRILNFGHTIGHALEACAHYSMSHGEAVAIGSLVEAHLSMQLGYLSKAEFEQIHLLYQRLHLSLPKTYTRQALLQAMAYDKKNLAGQVRFVLIDRIGHAIEFDGAYCKAIAHSELEKTLHWMERTYGL